MPLNKQIMNKNRQNMRKVYLKSTGCAELQKGLNAGEKSQTKKQSSD